MGLLSMQHQPHQPQGHPPSQHPGLQPLHSRPSSVVHQQTSHHNPSSNHQPPSQNATSAYSTHGLPQSYSHSSQNNSTSQDNLPYYSQQSPYSTPGAASGYTSADTSEMMAAAQIPRPQPHHYPPMSYHTPQSNSPASVPSPSQHDQHRSIYAQPPSQMSQSMYYQSQPSHYQSLPPQHNASPYGQPPPNASPYGQHTQHPQQSMTSQPNMMMPHPAQNHMTQHATQHAQAGMAGSPRPKMEPQVPLQLQKPQGSPMPQPQHGQNGGPQLQSPGSQTGPNANAAPGPIPATTPLVVRQDGNGVQWIAFEYSRDRVKMEYTIRCDVESVLTDELSAEFKQENCVYPRACCAKEAYRGNRLNYETDCNRVGWALAQLNPPLRGKRGLIQRAVDSWRNSNQDPRLRSRRVRRMAKMNTRKSSATPQIPTSAAPTPTMAQNPGSMGPAGAPPMGKPGMGHMAQQPMHQQHPGAQSDGHPQGGADEVGDNYHHHQGSNTPGGGNDVRQNQVFTGYGGQGYPSAAPPAPMSQMGSHSNGAAPAGRRQRNDDDEQHSDLFPDMPEAKKRKFVLVEDNVRGSRLRVRVNLQGVDTDEIPDSFRKTASVFPHSFFPREMQSPPPSATGTKFFPDDYADDGIQETEGGRGSGSGGSHNARNRGGGVKRKPTEMVRAMMGEDQEGEVAIERMSRSLRQKEVKLNDLGHRMSWLQSRVFAGRTVFLQRALDCYRAKTRVAIEGTQQDIRAVAPHFETRVGKRKWLERTRGGVEEE